MPLCVIFINWIYLCLCVYGKWKTGCTQWVELSYYGVFLFSMLGTKPRASHALGRGSAAELHPRLYYKLAVLYGLHLLHKTVSRAQALVISCWTSHSILRLGFAAMTKWTCTGWPQAIALFWMLDPSLGGRLGARPGRSQLTNRQPLVNLQLD